MATITSAMARREIEAVLPKSRLKVWSALKEMGRPCTANELVWIKGIEGAWKRLSELRKMGVVKESGISRCPVTGKKALLWEPTSASPMKLSKPISKTARLDRYFRFADVGLAKAIEFIKAKGASDDESKRLLAFLQYTRQQLRNIEV